MPSKRLFQMLLALLMLAVSGTASRSYAQSNTDLSRDDPAPNILILIGDDIDRDSLGPWGGQAVTPNLDQLAADGMRFDNVYANVAMCAPFRQELYSGRSAWRTRAMPNHSRSLPETRSLPHYLRPLGYRVGLLGKSHVGPRECYPFDRLGELPNQEDNNPEAIRLAKQYMVEAVEEGQPFCLVIASNDGHSPFTNGDRSIYDKNKLQIEPDAIDTDAYRDQLVAHLAEVSHLDQLLGELREVLEDEALTENTLVIFCSEQGNAFPFSKWTCFDDGLSSGVVASLPGRIPEGSTCDEMFWISDVAPTLIEAAGGHLDDMDFDGRSQWENFQGGEKELHRFAYGAFTNCNIIDNRERVFPIRSIRDSRYSLIWSPRHAEEITSNVSLSQALTIRESSIPESTIRESSAEVGNPNTAGSWALQALDSEATEDDELVARFFQRPEWALYDRSTDPEELLNLIDDPQYVDISRELKQELKSWLESHDDSDPVATERGFVRQR
ncbi:MAG: sulfatase [Planctomycetota bacterium]